ncbi:MAG: phosphoribosylanthranilate isomerase [Vampirovibrionia bacterium]
MLRIKICGLTNLADAYMALKLGADFLGFNNIKGSKRFIDIIDIKDIIERMPESLRDKCVLLAEDVDLQSIIKTAKSLNITSIQPYITNPTITDADYVKVRERGMGVFRVIHVENKRSISDLSIDPNSADYFILDTKSSDPSELGGTGASFDWYLYNCAKAVLPEKKMVLAGGINIKNLDEAVEYTETRMVDLSSGIEDSPGIKSHDKMQALFAHIKGVSQNS